MTEAHLRTPCFNMDFYPREFLSTSAPVRPFITLSYCRIPCTACVRPIWVYRHCATLANIPFEYFRVTRCPVCFWRSPDRGPFRCSHLCMVLPVASSCRRNRHLFYYVATPLQSGNVSPFWEETSLGVTFHESAGFAYKEEAGFRFLLPFSRRLR